MLKSNFKTVYVGFLLLIIGSAMGMDDERSVHSDLSASGVTPENIIPFLKGKISRVNRKSANKFAEDLLTKSPESPEIPEMVERFRVAMNAQNDFLTTIFVRLTEELIPISAEHNSKAWWMTARFGTFLLSLDGLDNSWLSAIPHEFGTASDASKLNYLLSKRGMFASAIVAIKSGERPSQASAGDLDIFKFSNMIHGAMVGFIDAACELVQLAKQSSVLVGSTTYAIPTAIQAFNKAMNKAIRSRATMPRSLGDDAFDAANDNAGAHEGTRLINKGVRRHGSVNDRDDEDEVAVKHSCWYYLFCCFCCKSN